MGWIDVAGRIQGDADRKLNEEVAVMINGW